MKKCEDRKVRKEEVNQTRDLFDIFFLPGFYLVVGKIIPQTTLYICT